MKQLTLSLILTLILAGCNLGTGGVTPIPTPDIPTIEILAPANNQQVIEDFEFELDIVARDASQGIALIELYVDELLINFSSPVDVTSAPVFRTAMNWRAIGVGRHVIEVIAYRPDGTQGDPARINIEVLSREE